MAADICYIGPGERCPGASLNALACRMLYHSQVAVPCAASTIIRQARQLPVSLLIALGVAMSLLVGLGGLSYLNIEQQGNAARWVEHTYRVAVALKDIFASVQDAESSQRMFSTSGVESYLGRCNAAFENLPGQMFRARGLVNDNPVQVARLKALQSGYR